MANNQPISAVAVIANDDINIPKPGIIISGTNTGGPGTTLTDVGKGFTNPETNPKGFNINGGDVVYDSAGTIVEVVRVIDSDNIEVSGAIVNGTYEIYKGNGDIQFPGSMGFSLFVGTGGAGSTLAVRTISGNNVTLNNIPDSSFIPLQVMRVLATGTTCSDILALN